MSRRYAEATPAFLWLWRRRLRPVPPGAGLSLVLDRTGLFLVGAGAWAAAIPGGPASVAGGCAPVAVIGQA